MIINGVDTDDLTHRQYHFFHRMNCINRDNDNVLRGIPSEFAARCVHRNFREQQFDNYDGDCDYLYDYLDREWAKEWIQKLIEEYKQG